MKGVVDPSVLSRRLRIRRNYWDRVVRTLSSSSSSSSSLSSLSTVINACHRRRSFQSTSRLQQGSKNDILIPVASLKRQTIVDSPLESCHFFSTVTRSREIKEYVSSKTVNDDDKTKTNEPTSASTSSTEAASGPSSSTIDNTNRKEWKALKQKSKLLEREGMLSLEPWRKTQLAMVRSLLESWLKLEPSTQEQHRERATWCTRIVKRWILHVAPDADAVSVMSDLGDQDAQDSEGNAEATKSSRIVYSGASTMEVSQAQLDSLLQYWFRSIMLWKFQGATLDDAVHAMQLLISFCNAVVPIFDQPGSNATLTEFVDKAFTNVMSLLVRQQPLEHAAKMIRYAERLWEDRLVLDPVLGVVPSMYLWTSFLTVLARCTPYVSDDGGTDMERVLTIWEDMRNSGGEPNDVALSILLLAWSRSKRPDAGVQVENLLNQYPQCRQNMSCINLAIETWGRCGFPEKAEELLWNYVYGYQQQQEQKTNTDSPDSQVNPSRQISQPFYFAIQAWGRSDRPEARERAYDILVKMNNLYDSGLTVFKPRCDVYEALMGAWATKPDSGESTEKLLRQVQASLGDDVGDDELASYAALYIKAIDAWKNTKSDAAPKQAQKLLNEIRAIAKQHATPRALLDKRMYMKTIQAWASQTSNKLAPDQAFAILRQMQDEDGLVADTFVYNAVIHAYARQGRADEAEFLLDEMKDESVLGNHSSGPDAFSYSFVIQAYYNSGYATRGEKQCRDLVKEMEDAFDNKNDRLRPNHLVYKSLIGVVGQNSAQEASLILQHMMDRHVANQKCPEVTTLICNAVLGAWCYSRDGVAPQRVEALLDWMKEQSLEDEKVGHKPVVAPDLTSYRFAMKTWAISSRKSTKDHINRLLDDMISRNLVSSPADDSALSDFQVSIQYASDTDQIDNAVDELFSRFKPSLN